jgi:hypothetical protein
LSFAFFTSSSVIRDVGDENKTFEALISIDFHGKGNVCDVFEIAETDSVVALQSKVKANYNLYYSLL